MIFKPEFQWILNAHLCIFTAAQREKDIRSESGMNSSDSPQNIDDNVNTIDRMKTIAMPIGVRKRTNNHLHRANRNGNISQRVIKKNKHKEKCK